jgi:hypothetical protein
MAKIETYPNAATVVGADTLIGTDTDDLNATKTFTVSQLSAYVQSQINGAIISEQQVYGFEGSNGLTITSAAYQNVGISESATLSTSDISVVTSLDASGFAFKYTGAATRAFQVVFSTRAVVVSGTPVTLTCKVYKSSSAVTNMLSVIQFNGQTEAGFSATFPIKLTSSNETIDFRWKTDQGTCTLDDLWVQVFST